MNSNQEFSKKDYQVPVIVSVELDNEISLQLESTPPLAPFESMNQTPDYFNNDPFKA